jgi:hypothetical protein
MYYRKEGDYQNHIYRSHQRGAMGKYPAESCRAASGLLSVLVEYACRAGAPGDRAANRSWVAVV